MENQEVINEFGLKVTKLIEEYASQLPAYEIGHQLIMQATSMLLFTAPSEIIGVKTIFTCVQSGLESYDEMNS